MLHFLIGVAVTIFIGERLWHYVLSDRYLRIQLGKMVLGFGGAAVGLAVIVLVLIASSGGRHIPQEPTAAHAALECPPPARPGVNMSEGEEIRRAYKCWQHSE